MKLARRQLLQCGIAGGIALALAGRLAATPRQPGFAATADDRVLIGALAGGLFGGQLPIGLPVLVDNVTRAIDGLPLAMQGELRELFDVLHQPLARRLLGLQAPWGEASASSVQALLQGWRGSRLALLRSAYQAVHGLLYAACYGDTRSWAAIDYRLPASIKGYLT